MGRPPRIVRRDAADGLTRLIAIVDVDASREDAADWLSGAVAARAGDLLVAPPRHRIGFPRRVATGATPPGRPPA